MDFGTFMESLGDALGMRLETVGGASALDIDGVTVMLHDAEERVKREAEVFTAAAKKIGEGMAATWKGQLDQYMTEFDFTNEAKNVNEGMKIYSVAGNPFHPYWAVAPSVRSMQLSDIVKTTKNAMVCDLAEGETIDRIVSGSRREIDGLFGKVFVTDPKTGKPKRGDGTDGKKTLVMRDDAAVEDILKARVNAGRMYDNLVVMQKKLMEAGKVWFSEALLASGKFHGDAHAGNLMFANTGDLETDGIPFIDFGNLYQLKTATPLLDAEGKQVIGKNGQPETVNERVELLRLILGATLRNDAFVLQSVERLLSSAGKAALAANRAKAEAVVKANNDKGNFSGKDKISLGLSAKAISQEIGGSFFESIETTTNRLVKGAKVLGENDARNTNVDNIQIAEDEENRIELGV